MSHDARYEYVQELLHEWTRWGTLERAAAVVRLRDESHSLRALAKIAGCSEGTIRNYEILGRVPWAAKQVLCEGRISMRRLVEIVREARNPIPRPGNDESGDGASEDGV